MAQVETQSSDLSGTVTGKEITQLELNGRNFTQLATLVPGVSNQSGQDEAGVGVGGNVSFSINGGRTEYNNWELDGGDNMDNGSNTTLNVYPSLDAIAEFKVLTSNYGAQYGRNGSGTVEVETKSGTRSFHGDAYEFVRNDIFNATNFPQSTVPAYKKNDFGYTIGGPVFIPGVYNKDRSKTFFFWSQEWRKERVPANLGSVTVPSLAERGGDFNDVCPGVNCPEISPGTPFPGNIVPIDTANAPALIAEIPAPTNGATTWNASPTLPTTWREELIRVDHNFTDKNARHGPLHPRFMAADVSHSALDQRNQLSHHPDQLRRAGSEPGYAADRDGFADSAERICVQLHHRPHHADSGGCLAAASQHDVRNLSGRDQGKVPGISLGGGGVYNFGEDVGYMPNGPYNSNPTYTYRDNVTKIIGKHNLQFGGYFVAAQKNELAAPGTATNGVLTFDTTNAAVSTGNAFADLLTGRVSSFSQTSAQPKFYNRYKIFEPYFQDDWHVTSHLTLNLGVRVSLFGTYRDRYHSEYNFDVYPLRCGGQQRRPGDRPGDWQCLQRRSAMRGHSGVPDGCMKGHLFNPAPRIGFAWDPKGNGKTAIRGGYGVFFEHTNGNEANAESLESAASPAVQTLTVKT